MALFGTDSEVKAALRLSGMPATADGEAQFQKAVLRASVKIRTVLGETALQLVTDTGAFALDRARLIEYDLVYCELLYSMPYASLDGSAGMDTWYNQEAPFRHLGDSERVTLRQEICQRGADELAKLADDLGLETDADNEIQCWIMDGPPEYDPSICGRDWSCRPC